MDRKTPPEHDKLWYIASPYTGTLTEEKERCRQVRRFASHLIFNEHLIVFSPTAHSVSIVASVPSEAGSNWDIWRRQDLAVLERCDGMIVLKLPGWEESVGVQAELRYARDRGMEIRFCEPAKN